MQAPVTYPNLEAFYAADWRRRTSGEADYGVWWLDKTTSPHWRVRYVHATGEVYAAQLGDHGAFGARVEGVEVLGVVPPYEEQVGPHHRPWQRYYRTLDKVLEGWADHCGQLGGLDWVRQRLAEYSKPVESPNAR